MSEKIKVGIPDYWKECTSQSGRKYFYNTISKQSIWEKPFAIFKESEWVQKVSTTGELYYFNINTRKTTRTQPVDWVTEPHQKTDCSISSVEDSNKISADSDSDMNRHVFNPNPRGRGRTHGNQWQHPYNPHYQTNHAQRSQNDNFPRFHNHSQYILGTNDFRTNQRHYFQNNPRYNFQTNQRHSSPGNQPNNFYQRKSLPNSLPNSNIASNNNLSSRSRVYEDIDRNTEPNQARSRRSSSVGPCVNRYNGNHKEQIDRELSFENLKNENQRDFMRQDKRLSNQEKVSSVNLSNQRETSNPSLQPVTEDSNNETPNEVPQNSDNTTSPNPASKRKVDSDDNPTITKRPRVLLPVKSSSASDNDTSPPNVTTGSFLQTGPHAMPSRSPPLRKSRFDKHYNERLQNEQEVNHHDHSNSEGNPNFVSNYVNNRFESRCDQRHQRRHRGSSRNRRSEPYTASNQTQSPVMKNESSRGRTPAQDRMLRIQAQISTTPTNQQPAQTPQTWPRDNRQQNSTQSNASAMSPRRSKYGDDMSQSPSPNQSALPLRSPKSQTPAQNSQMSYESSSQFASQSSLSVNDNDVFAHPSQSWTSPVRRERSSSMSSSMSVENSPTFSFTSALQRLNKKAQESDNSTEAPVNPAQACGVNPPNTEVTSQECMEWETIPTAVIVEKVVEVRQHTTPSKEGIVVPRNSGRITESTSINDKMLVLVIDTNVFLSAIEFLSRVRDQYTEEYGYPILYIPWQVVQELDAIKDRCTGNRPLKLRVTEAIRFIEANLRSAHARIKFQDQDSMKESKDVLEHKSPDDRILAGGLHLAKKLSLLPNIEPHVLLISEDVNLRNKSIICNLLARSVAEIEEVVFKENRLLPITTPMDEAEIRTRKQMDDLFCQIKTRMFECMSELLIEAMKLKAGPRLAWQKYVFHKPPWDWTKIFRNYHQHLISFSDLISTDPRQLNPTLNTLKTVILKYEKDSTVTLDILQTFVREAAAFARVIKHPLRTTMLNDIRAYQSLLTKLASQFNAVNGSSSRSPKRKSSSPCNSSVNKVIVKSENSTLKPFIISEDRRSSSSCSSTASSSLNDTASRNPADYSANPVNVLTNGTPPVADRSTLKETQLKVFESLNALYIKLESFSSSAHKFFKIDTGQDVAQIKDIDVDEFKNFTDYMFLACRLTQYLEKIFKNPDYPACLSIDTFALQQLFSVLPRDSSFTIEQLLVALQDVDFYAEISRGIKQFSDLNEQYDVLCPLVRKYLQFSG